MKTHSLYHMLGTLVLLAPCLAFRASAQDALCDSYVYLSGAQPLDNLLTQDDGLLFYNGKSQGATENLCIVDNKSDGGIRRFVIENATVGTTPITLTHTFSEVTARAFPDTLNPDPAKRASEHVVAQCGVSPGLFQCRAYPDPMSMIVITTGYTGGEPSSVQFSLDTPRAEVRKNLKIDHALSTQSASIQLPNGRIILFPFSTLGNFIPSPASTQSFFEFLQSAPDSATLDVSLPVRLNNGQSTVMKTQVTIGQIKLASKISDTAGGIYAKRSRLKLQQMNSN